ncbi:hypothetical protein FA13DRAFT_1800636 [Coprinellus micaceus]|uniref:Uncharacterized protein n=1 Tax=Coprinellus micaceus TaxID=71717 RepID=A0A4Y7SG06_COPMI|nr:hypothetical protein FA13DRAFT_1800636 [Coprinellus micaceus]
MFHLKLPENVRSRRPAASNIFGPAFDSKEKPEHERELLSPDEVPMEMLNHEDALQRAFEIRNDLANAIRLDGEDITSARGDAGAAIRVLTTRTEVTPPSYESHMFNAYVESPVQAEVPARGHVRAHTELVAIVPDPPPQSNFTAHLARSEADLGGHELALESPDARARVFTSSEFGAAASRTETDLLMPAGTNSSMDVVPVPNQRSKPSKARRIMAGIGDFLKHPLKGMKRKAEDDEDIHLVTIASQTKRRHWVVDGERQLFAEGLVASSTPRPSISSPRPSFVSPGSPLAMSGSARSALGDGPTDYSASRISLSPHNTTNHSRPHSPTNTSILYGRHNRSTTTFGSFNSFPPARSPTPGPDIRLPGGSPLAAPSDASGPSSVTPFALYYEGHKPGVDDRATRARASTSAHGSLTVDPMKAALIEDMEKHAKRHIDNPALGKFGNKKCPECRYLKLKSEFHKNEDEDEDEGVDEGENRMQDGHLRKRGRTTSSQHRAVARLPTFQPPNYYPLPVEVLSAIFAELVHHDGHLTTSFPEGSNSNCTGPIELPEGRTTLVKLAQTSHLFSSISVSLLWQSLRVRSTEDALSLLKAMDRRDRLNTSTLGGSPSALSHQTRRLDLQIPSEYQAGVIRDLLARLPNLEILVFSNGAPRAGPTLYIPQGVIDAVSTSCTRLKKLQFRSMLEQPTITHLSKIAEACREICTLQIVAIETQCLPRIPSPELPETTPLFKSLRSLSLGPGPDHFPPYSEVGVRNYPQGLNRIRLVEFFRMLGVQMNDLPVLREVHLFGEMVSDADQTFVEKTHSTVQVILCGSSWRCWMDPGRWAAFTNLRWLVIMIQENVDEVPKGLLVLEGVEVQQEGVNLPKYDMELVTQCVLTGVLRAGYQSLRKVVLRLSPHYSNQQDWKSQYEWLFEGDGVVFIVETATPSEIWPQHVLSAHL